MISTRFLNSNPEEGWLGAVVCVELVEGRLKELIESGFWAGGR